MPCPYNVKAGAVVNSLTQQRIHGLKQRLRLQNHAFATAERAVVHGTMPIMGESAQIVHAHIRQASFARAPHDPGIERAGKEIGKNGYDIEPHGRHSVSKLKRQGAGHERFKSRKPSGRATSMRFASTSIRVQNSAARGTSTSPSLVRNESSGTPPGNSTLPTTPSA